VRRGGLALDRADEILDVVDSKRRRRKRGWPISR
jgi:hypothetical protein